MASIQKESDPEPEAPNAGDPEPGGALALNTLAKKVFAGAASLGGTLASVAVFAAPFVRTAPAVIGVTIAVLAVGVLLGVVVMVFYTYREVKITTSVNVTAGLVILLLASGAGVGYAAWHHTIASGSQSGRSATTTAVQIAVGSEDLDLFANPAVQSYFLQHGYNVTATGFGSLDIATHADPKLYDLALPSSRVTTDALMQRLAAASVPSKPLFTTPLVVLTWKPLVPLLEQLKIASQKADGTWTFDIAAYLAVAHSGTLWSQIPGNTGYDNNNQVQLQITDPGMSNSGLMFLAAASSVINKGAVVSTPEQADAAAAQLTPLLKNLGGMERTTGDLFDQYLNYGQSGRPLVLSYESQFVGTQLAEPGKIPPDAVMMYTNPAVNSDHTLVSFNSPAANAFFHVVTGDSTLQAIAENDYGFRSAAEPQFVADMKRRGITVEPDLPVISVPTFAILEDILHATEK